MAKAQCISIENIAGNESEEMAWRKLGGISGEMVMAYQWLAAA
jgi:hypothetical protein